MIALNPFSFKKQHFVAWVLVALPLLIANSAARAQSTDATAQEKQHAQNAAAAINRDDWQAAKELKEQLNTAPSEHKSAGSSWQGPSLDETLNFIQAKLSGIGKLSYDSIATSNETNYTVTNR